MINNLVSINTVLQEIVRDLGLGDTPIPFHDIKEWIIEGLKHIGVKAQFREEIRDIEIKDYTGKLPCETYKISELINGYCYRHNNNLTLDDDDKNKQDTINTVAISDRDYNIQFNEVTTTFQEGIMKFRLMLLPIDEQGFVMVPDLVSYKDALMWKLAYHLVMRGHKFPQTRMNDMEYNWIKWQFYCKQARGTARMPDKALMEVFKNEFNKLILDPHQILSNFREAGRPEVLNLDSRNPHTNVYPFDRRYDLNG